MLAVQVQLNCWPTTTKINFHPSRIYLKTDTVMEVEMNEANL